MNQVSSIQQSAASVSTGNDTAQQLEKLKQLFGDTNTEGLPSGSSDQDQLNSAIAGGMGQVLSQAQGAAASGTGIDQNFVDQANALGINSQDLRAGDFLQPQDLEALQANAGAWAKGVGGPGSSNPQVASLSQSLGQSPSPSGPATPGSTPPPGPASMMPPVQMQDVGGKIETSDTDDSTGTTASTPSTSTDSTETSSSTTTSSLNDEIMSATEEIAKEGEEVSAKIEEEASESAAGG